MKCPKCNGNLKGIINKYAKSLFRCDGCDATWNETYVGGYWAGHAVGLDYGSKTGEKRGRRLANFYVHERLDDILRVHALRRPTR